MLDFILLVAGIFTAMIAAVSRGLNRAVVLVSLSMLLLAAAYGYAGLRFLAVAQVMTAGGTIALFNLVSSSFKDDGGSGKRLAAIIPAAVIAFGLAAAFNVLRGEAPVCSVADKLSGSEEALGLLLFLHSAVLVSVVLAVKKLVGGGA